MCRVYIISVFFLFGISKLCSQNIRDNSRYLYWGVSLDDGGVNLYYDSVHLNSNRKDTVSFGLQSFKNNKVKIEEFYKIDKKVYFVDQSEWILLYDYGMQVKDTFKLERFNVREDFILDSIVDIKYEDNRYYKNYYLHSINNNFYKLIWIEGLGEKNHGWNYLSYKSFDLPSLTAICANDSIVFAKEFYYYYISEKGRETKYLTPDCAYLPIMKAVEIDVFSKDKLTISNHGNGHVDFSLVQSVDEVFVFDLFGRKVDFNRDFLSIDFKNEVSGVYFIHYKSNGKSNTIKYMKL